MGHRHNSDIEEVAVLASVMALALRGGTTVVASIDLALEGASGRVASHLARVAAEANLGRPIGKVLAEAAERAGSPPLEELLSKLQLATELGSSLADQLDQLSFSLRNQAAIHRQALATASETKMLLPLVFLILPVTVLFALYPSLQILNIQMEGI